MAERLDFQQVISLINEQLVVGQEEVGRLQSEIRALRDSYCRDDVVAQRMRGALMELGYDMNLIDFPEKK